MSKQFVESALGNIDGAGRYRARELYGRFVDRSQGHFSLVYRRLSDEEGAAAAALDGAVGVTVACGIEAG